jgi:hypothetical protein
VAYAREKEQKANFAFELSAGEWLMILNMSEAASRSRDSRKTKHGFASATLKVSALLIGEGRRARLHSLGALFLPANNKSGANVFGLKPKVGKVPRIRSLPTRIDDRVRRHRRLLREHKKCLEQRSESLNCALDANSIHCASCCCGKCNL